MRFSCTACRSYRRLTSRSGPGLNPGHGMAHPQDRPGFTRSKLLRGAAGGVVAVGAGGLLAGCENTTTPIGACEGGGLSPLVEPKPTGPGGLPLARPNKRVTLPRWEDPIASGLPPETGGSFEIFNYPDYLYLKLFKEFCAKYNVSPQYTPFDNIASGIQRLATGSVSPDVMEMTPDNLDQVVAGKLIKPLNLDYIPNLKKNVWPQLVSPFYDSESRYTVPYICYATGILWRNDHV